MTNHLLEVKELETSLFINKQWYPTVDKVSFKLEKGEVLGVVGESGCGKSILNKSIIKLLPDKISKITHGEVIFEGKRIDEYNESDFLKIRGNDIGMIFQEPMTALNPVFKIKNQIIESILVHQKKSKKEAYQEAKDLLLKVGISRQEEVLNSYPHQLSGGMRQRVMIAMAISCSPKLLIADEPTTALDVTIQAQILDLLKNIQKDTQMSIILITHDLSVVSEFCDKVMVMYAGQIVEYGNLKEILENPKHPYTKKLLRTIPTLDSERERLETIEGIVPSITEFQFNNCRFANRCDEKLDICNSICPSMSNINDTLVRCHLFDRQSEAEHHE
ncbi:ABC transporter ATP-binding protein [Staphylococcus caprae]|uniref:Oligopeptide transport ATP-binding protein n=3 Tax=Staphylococcus TaxID=1279 RepID=A0ABN5W4U0_9STAP|nr:ABC transporter ATP-binding protein [Staphylococcus caprae]EES40700.1 ABC transporter, ATP-binding protein [Staphylococcus caprae M23864:W1]MBN6825099.1 ABC transporter ATP-binding protein [Staphylococcus caprae]MBX5316723.1 ABC transporter ATP-binding protein [Staphylococcus caprae]MBX5322373.1 ABC transporter ATP-binding protein [Staphylococcus caprae]MCI2954208.1 ABC transporter ATP-binding protein [Staphylococcus caprae]